MRLARVAVAALAFFSFVGLAVASPVNNDVNLGIKDPTCSGSCILITSSTFSFIMPSVPSGGSSSVTFENGTNGPLTSFDFDLFTGTGVTTALFSCSIDPLIGQCLVAQITSTIHGDNEFQIVVSQPSCHPNGEDDSETDDSCGGIPPGGVFEFSFTNPPGSDTTLDWAGAGLTVNVSPTPEPGTLALLASGLIPLWSLRRKWLN